MRILLAEDDDLLAPGIAMALRQSGYAVDNVKSGTDADQTLERQAYDLVILDLGLPGIDGLEVLKRIRTRGQSMPVLILTARDRLEDRIRGLDMGANDYMSKPFDVPELEARIRALLRKEKWGNRLELQIGELTFDTQAKRVSVRGVDIEFSPRELAVLELLLQKAGKVVDKDDLIGRLADKDYELTYNALDILMHRLRKKLEESGCIIRTLRGLGYMVEKP